MLTRVFPLVRAQGVRRCLSSILVLLLTLPLAAGAQEAGRRPNVLLISIDDLNDWVGCLGGHPQARTPRIDELARRGVLFANAHCQAPICAPSRASLLSGRRPSSFGLYTLHPALRAVPALADRVMLPQLFERAGYATYCAGKVYHDGSVKRDPREGEFQTWGTNGPVTYPKKKIVETPSRHRMMDWGIVSQSDDQQADWKIASEAEGWLRSLPADKPFFMAVGFRMPHLPCFATKRWFDLFPAENLILPPVKADDRADVPDFAWYLHWKLPEPRLSWLQQHGQWASLVRAYLASTSFMDSQIGRVLDALESSGQAGNTVVVLWSDNGWHLGEKGFTGKTSLWERSTHVPLIFAGPGIARDGRTSQSVELLDVYPTLSELCGLKPPADLEGHSLVPQLRDPATIRPWPAITTANAYNHAVRSERWRFIQYADGSRELYDMKADPHEWTNLAGKPEYADIIAEHARYLPANPVPPVPGSRSRHLAREGETWTWEGKPIVPGEQDAEAPGSEE